MNIEFNSIKELYDRVHPALKSKVRELRKNKITYIKEVDVWNCLTQLKWKSTKGLLLSDIVDDILNVDNNIIENYVKEEMKKIEKNANLDIDII